MSKGNREALIDCLHGVTYNSKEIEREELHDKDVIESLIGVA